MSFLQFPPCLAVTSFLQRLTISGSGPAKSSPLDSVNGNGEGERRIAVADFKGKFLVIIFFKNNDSKEFLKAFSDLADLFRGNKIEVWKYLQKNCQNFIYKKTYVWIFGVGPKWCRGWAFFSPSENVQSPWKLPYFLCIFWKIIDYVHIRRTGMDF